MPNNDRCLRTLASMFALAAWTCAFMGTAEARRLRACDPLHPSPRRHCRPNDVPKRSAPKDNHPAIEAGGTVPGIDNTIPLLRPGTLRLDLSGFVQNFDLTGARGGPGGPTSLQSAFMLGYGVTDRFTVFGGALQANVVPQDKDLHANFIDPKVGFVYRLATAPQLKGIALDFVGDAALNEPLRPTPSSFGPYGNLEPIVRGRLLATKELGHGFTLQLQGGLLGTSITMPAFASVPSQTTFDIDALLGLAGQYRLSAISNRLYVNGELDLMKPLTRNEGQVLFASPFTTTENYSATIGASYVIKPGAIVGRLSDTVTLNVADDNTAILNRNSKYSLANTVGVTISFVNLKPGSWLPALSR